MWDIPKILFPAEIQGNIIVLKKFPCFVPNVNEFDKSNKHLALKTDHCWIYHMKDKRILLNIKWEQLLPHTYNIDKGEGSQSLSITTKSSDKIFTARTILFHALLRANLSITPSYETKKSKQIGVHACSLVYVINFNTKRTTSGTSIFSEITMASPEIMIDPNKYT